SETGQEETPASHRRPCCAPSEPRACLQARDDAAILTIGCPRCRRSPASTVRKRAANSVSLAHCYFLHCLHSLFRLPLLRRSGMPALVGAWRPIGAAVATSSARQQSAAPATALRRSRRLRAWNPP